LRRSTIMSASDSLVMADESPAHNIETGQVKFTKDSESIDVNGEQKLIGLTKEQLERYRNDPLWKPIRYTLFVLFWLVWIGMFAGAIIIVVMSPKCQAKKVSNPADTMVAYQLFTPTFRDSDGDGVGDFNGIKEKLNDLRRVGVTTVWPTPLLTTTKDDFKISEIRDSLTVDPRFGTEKDLKELIERAHDLNLYFIADLPLTIASDSPQAGQQGIGGAGKVRLLNLANSEARQTIKKTAAKLIGLGVDGLNFAQYGLPYPPGSIDALKLDELAIEIHRENVDKFHVGDPNLFTFIADTAVERPTRAINFYSRSLGRFANTPKICQASTDFISCLKESARDGALQVKKNATSLPLWQFGDVTHARTDSLFGNINESAQASSLTTAIQLFLPGPVKIYYGEELGLPSVNQTDAPQFGIMQWDEGEKGFTDLIGEKFFKSIPTTQAAKLNFKSQYDDLHSHVKVFKKLANFRVRDEVFIEGDYTSGKIEGIHVFVRKLEGDEKAYFLVANWPAANDNTAKSFYVKTIADPFVKVTSAELLIDHPVNEANPWQITVDSTKLTLNPYEFMLIRGEVTA